MNSCCEGVGGVQGALTLFYGGVAQAFHDDRVVELKEQLVVEEVDEERQAGKVTEEGRGGTRRVRHGWYGDGYVTARNLIQ